MQLKILKSKNGEGYIDMAIIFLIVIMLIYFAICLWSLVAVKQDMRYMCDELLNTATINGRIGDEVDMRFTELCEKSGITPDVNFSAKYFDSTTGKVQLGDVITCSLKYKMRLPGFGDFKIPITITVTKSDLSRIYWKR